MSDSKLFMGNSFSFGLMTGGLCLGWGGLFLSSSNSCSGVVTNLQDDTTLADCTELADVEGTPVLKEDGTAALTESGSAWLKE